MNTAALTLTALLAGALVTSATRASELPSPPAAQAFELRMDGKADDAAALLHSAIAQTPRDASIWFELARTELYLFHFDEAVGAIGHATELAPENARYQYFAGLTEGYHAVSMAHSAETQDQVEPAMGRSLGAFARAVEIDPGFYDARIELINMFLQAPSKHGGSRAKARKHVEVLEADDAVYGVKGRCMLLRDGQDDKAVALWDRVVESHPNRADAHAGLARALLFAGDTDRAAAHIDDAIRLDPAQDGILLTFCRECVSDGELPRAQEAAERYLAASPSRPAPMRAYATFILAKLQQMQGNNEQGDALLAEARGLDGHVWMTYMEPRAVLFEALAP